jgi:hypothetical protein
MKAIIPCIGLFALLLMATPAQAGIFGRRGAPAPQPQLQSQPQAQSTQSTYRSNSYQPSMPFSSRSRPQDWHEAHRGYGVKIRGW